MTHFSLALITISVLAACEYTPMYKVGASEQETNVTQAQCNTFAANTVPPMIITDRYPVYDNRDQIVGYRSEVYDVNEGRRHTAVRTCMQEQGFSRINIPYCKNEQLKGRDFTALQQSPPITDSVCAVRQPSGNHVLIDLNQSLN
ncbi:hypothetical protein [Pseudopelagicola sp. nBUS_19]|uniref:hypothetical protein n=1 Tax=Pseudopelagicola sp. nBUS_19 TaxID=3395316 RepID=UPI003EB6F1EF